MYNKSVTKILFIRDKIYKIKICYSNYELKMAIIYLKINKLIFNIFLVFNLFGSLFD